MINIRIFLLLSFVFILAGVACSRGDSNGDTETDDLEISIDVAPDPPEAGPATITVTLRDGDGDPVNDADLEIEGTMNHAGMEPVFSDATGEQEGRYVSQDFEFTMGGDWIIIIHGTLEDGAEFEREFDLAGVEG